MCLMQYDAPLQMCVKYNHIYVVCYALCYTLVALQGIVLNRVLYNSVDLA